MSYRIYGNNGSVPGNYTEYDSSGKQIGAGVDRSQVSPSSPPNSSIISNTVKDIINSGQNSTPSSNYNNPYPYSAPASPILQQPMFDPAVIFQQAQQQFKQQLADLQSQWQTQTNQLQTQLQQAQTNNANQNNYLNSNQGMFNGLNTASPSTSPSGLNDVGVYKPYQGGAGAQIKGNGNGTSSAISRYLASDMWSKQAPK